MNYSADTKIEDDSHIEEIDGGKDLHITRSEYIEAQQDALAEARPPWEIIKENWKTFFVVVIVQVSHLFSMNLHSADNVSADQRYHPWT